MNERDGIITERLDRLPEWPYSRKLVLVITAAWFFVFFDIQNIAYALPAAAKAFSVSSAVGASVVSAGLLGYVIGSLMISALSDLKGRRVAIICAALMYSVGSLATGLSPSIGVFVVARFLTGAGVGATIAAMSTYLGEILPAAIRGRYAAWVTMPALVGIATVPFLALALVPTTAIGWRILLMVPVLGILPLLVNLRKVPESPRWLIEHGQRDLAEQVVRTAEMQIEQRRGSLPPVSVNMRPASNAAAENAQGLTLASALRPPFLRSTIVLFFVWFLNYFGAYGIAGAGIVVLVQHGFTIVTSIELTLGGSIGAVVGGLIAPQISDLWARKWPLFVATVILAVCLIVLGLAPSDWLIFAAFTLLFFQVGFFAPIGYLLTAEHFPTAGRNLGMALTDGLGHLGGVVGPIVALAVLQTAGFGPMWITFGVGFLLCAVTLLLTHDTTRQTLEAIVQTSMRGAPSDI